MPTPEIIIFNDINELPRTASSLCISPQHPKIIIFSNIKYLEYSIPLTQVLMPNITAQEEDIQCFYCKHPAPQTVKVYIQHEGDRHWFYTPPEGWFVADSYPPGDDGLRWACSIGCMNKGAS